jgi:hypothetical protein
MMNSFKMPALDMKALDSFSKASLSAAESYWRSFEEMTRLAAAANPFLQAFQSVRLRKTCEIPPPCWMPRSLGEIQSFVCSGGNTSVRIHVTNCQPRSSVIQLSFASGEAQGTVTPATATLGPMERETFSASFAVPANAEKGESFDLLLWVRGCNEYYLRWRVELSDHASDRCCHEISVNDCSDYVHHWYDHFYCDRRCSHTAPNTTDRRS